MDFYPLQKDPFVHISIDTHEEHELIADILDKIAKEKNKSLKRIQHLFFNKSKIDLHRRFWEILDTQLPGHRFEYVGICACGAFDLRTQLD
jgi:hypothetical protein